MQRAREEYLLHGSDGEVELLALVLGNRAAGRSSQEVAAELLDRFHGVRGIAKHPPGALTAVHGIGQARAVRVHAACTLAARARPVEFPAGRVDTPERAWRQLRERLEHLDVEELHALYLDRRARPLAIRRLSVGNDSSTIVDPRQVFRPAIQLGACSVIAAHNHPSGDPSPSAEDRAVTLRLMEAGELLGVPLLDHLVIGAGTFARVDVGGVGAW